MNSLETSWNFVVGLAIVDGHPISEVACELYAW